MAQAPVSFLDCINLALQGKPMDHLIPYPTTAGGGNGTKLVAGSASFVSGSAVIKTGFSTLTNIDVTLSSTGFATGATEITSVAVSGPMSATGNVTIQGYRLFTTTASASGTGLFYYTATGL